MQNSVFDWRLIRTERARRRYVSSPPAASGAPWASVKTSSDGALPHPQVAAPAQVLAPLRRHPPPRAATRRPGAGRPRRRRRAARRTARSTGSWRTTNALRRNLRRSSCELALGLVREGLLEGEARLDRRADPLAGVVVDQIDPHPLGARHPPHRLVGVPHHQVREVGGAPVGRQAQGDVNVALPHLHRAHELELHQRAVELGVDHAVHRIPHGGGADGHAVTSSASAPSACGPGPVDAFWPNWSARSRAPCSTGSMS